jgi:hypothetical protein
VVPRRAEDITGGCHRSEFGHGRRLGFDHELDLGLRFGHGHGLSRGLGFDDELDLGLRFGHGRRGRPSAAGAAGTAGSG